MADKYWDPKAIPVKQLTTVTVGGTLSGETFSISVNGVTIASHTDTDTVIATTVAALVSAWNASTHVYATGITATDASPDITLEADVAEVPFTITLNTPGGSATFTQAATRAPTGPHTWDEPLNWSGEAVPANSDVIYLRDSTSPIAWGLDGLSTTGHTVHSEASFTGAIGLDRSAFATSADGQTVDTSAAEYRQSYLQLDISRLEIGGHDGVGDPGNADRVMIDNDRAGASTTVVHSSAAVASEDGKPPIRLLFNHANADVEIRNALVGIAIDEPGETSTCGDIVVNNGGLFTGDGFQATNITHHGGDSRVNLGAAALTKALVHGGDLRINGDQAITTLEVTGGRCESNTTGTITTCEHKGGTVDYSVGREARTVTTHQLHDGAELLTNDDIVTITNLLEPDGPSRISVSSIAA